MTVPFPQHFKMSFHGHLAPMVQGEIHSHWNCCPPFVYPFCVVHFCLAALRMFTLSCLSADWLWCVWVWVSLNLPCIGFADLLESVSLYLLPNVGSFHMLCFQNFFVLHTLSFLFGTLMTQMLDLLISAHKFLRLCSFCFYLVQIV